MIELVLYVELVLIKFLRENYVIMAFVHYY